MLIFKTSLLSNMPWAFFDLTPKKFVQTLFILQVKLNKQVETLSGSVLKLHNPGLRLDDTTIVIMRQQRFLKQKIYCSTKLKES